MPENISELLFNYKAVLPVAEIDPIPVDENQLELHQAFVDINLAIK